MTFNWLRLGWFFLATLAFVLSVFAFSRSAPGMGLARVLAPSNMLWGSYIIVVAIFVGVLVWGTRDRPVLPMSGLLLLHLPGILSQSALDWGRLLWGTPLVPDAVVSPWETTTLGLGTAAVFTIAWVVARWEALVTVHAPGMDPVDRSRYLTNSFAWGTGVVSGAICISLITLSVAFALSARPQWMLSIIPWPIAMSGLSVVIVVSTVVYFLRFRWIDEGAHATRNGVKTELSPLSGINSPDAGTGHQESESSGLHPAER